MAFFFLGALAASASTSTLADKVPCDATSTSTYRWNEPEPDYIAYDDYVDWDPPSRAERLDPFRVAPRPPSTLWLVAQLVEAKLPPVELVDPARLARRDRVPGGERRRWTGRNVSARWTRRARA
jgi:hypothetical protein